ncbi:MAG: hypothetical protein IPG38_16695 [Chitinophagaceae bacterium]|nr:hypothetical protein [Chitinophagaceae bacterium]
MKIQQAATTEDLKRCYEVMKALRPHHNLESFLITIEQMFKEGYRLMYLEDNNRAGLCGRLPFHNNPVRRAHD